MIDYAALSEELAQESDSPSSQTVGEKLRAQRMDDLLTKVLEALTSQRELPAPVINVPEQAVPQVVVNTPPAPPPVSWKFSFVRNADGTIQDIIAKPI